MSTAVRKRPAAGQEPRVHGGKKPRYAFTSISDYEKLEVLGEGTYGEVFKARDRRTGKKVAVKWVRGNEAGGHGPPDMRAITREAGCQAACRGHESIVQILDVVTDAETRDVFLVMELVAGGQTLRESLWRPVSEEVTRVMMEQLLDAAKKIHGAGIIHRDIKPENVMVGIFGGLKVGDFGSAIRAKPAGVPYEECCVGTRIYTSPEQLEGNGHYGQAVDMWALGCIMAEMLGGDTLFVAETEEELLAEMNKLRDQISSTGKLDLDFFEELSEAGREVLTGLLAFNPDERITAGEALEHRWFSKPKRAEHPGFVC
ncbi:putative cyclin-dependent kinase F-2 [Hordeum vulgare subsp. vulgare]|uniref:[RNA-polymerase]-subunit kinase n=1 Tax=Hordeum vulgare subsp. vulgare TaxID=112509 RepID=A0A8I6WRJ9_HORVV|nr:putative cyclin-dependent kinase F-2 [Hordeum vulgare subsp. vulgare]